MAHKQERELSVSTPITLGDLRWLVEKSVGLSDDCDVDIYIQAPDRPFDMTFERISIRGEDD